jgi:hypothetical protein
MSRGAGLTDPRLLVAHLADGDFEHACELVRDDPTAVSLRSLLISPLWKYIEATRAGDASRDAALVFVQVAEDVVRHVDAGRPERARWLADNLQAAGAAFFLAVSASLLWQELPRRLHQKKSAAKASADARKADPVSKQARIIQAARRVRLTNEEKSVAGIVARQVGASDKYVRRVLKNAADQEKGT